jgi:hypothetical protein
MDSLPTSTTKDDNDFLARDGVTWTPRMKIYVYDTDEDRNIIRKERRGILWPRTTRR